MRDTYTLLLLWLFPVAISLHVFEEFALPGGLKQWIQEYKPRKARSDFYYFIINAAAIVGATILAWRASGTLGFCIYLNSVAIMAGNAASHMLVTFQRKQYCPGSISGGLLLVPLCMASNWYFLREHKVNLPSAVICLCLGAFVGFYVFGLHFKSARYGVTEFGGRRA